MTWNHRLLLLLRCRVWQYRFECRSMAFHDNESRWWILIPVKKLTTGFSRWPSSLQFNCLEWFIHQKGKHAKKSSTHCQSTVKKRSTWHQSENTPVFHTRIAGLNMQLFIFTERTEHNQTESGNPVKQDEFMFIKIAYYLLTLSSTLALSGCVSLF